MPKIIKDFLKEEDGLGTVEIVIIIAILVGLALLFKGVILDFVKGVLSGINENKNDAANTATEIKGTNIP